MHFLRRPWPKKLPTSISNRQMKTIPVRLPERSYRIIVGHDLVEKLPFFLGRLGRFCRVAVVTERRVARYHLSRLLKGLRQLRLPCHVLYLPAGEAAKEAGTLFRIYEFLAANRMERSDPLVAFGGGTVGDAAGFAASTYLRGIPLIQVGTTLLAQVDSSIGGKTGINLTEGKNLVGAFYQPKLVLSDVSLLRTLPRREQRASLAEVIKYGVIRDRALFEYVEAHLDAVLEGDQKSLETIVFRSARIKAQIVERDERETRGERMILNYGHTFGHAFEAAAHYRFRHGEAVALGMACAARLACGRGIFSVEDERRQNRLLERAGLPVRIKGSAMRSERVLHPMGFDKKKKGGRLRFVLPRAIGRVQVVEDVTEREVKRTLDALGGN